MKSTILESESLGLTGEVLKEGFKKAFEKVLAEVLENCEVAKGGMLAMGESPWGSSDG